MPKITITLEDDPANNLGVKVLIDAPPLKEGSNLSSAQRLFSTMMNAIEKARGGSFLGPTPSLHTSTNFKAEWDHFLAKAYPDNTQPDQRRQLKQAFFAGAFCVIKRILTMDFSTEDEGCSQLTALETEISSEIENMITALDQRN